MSKDMDYLEYKSPVSFHWMDSGPATFMCDYLTSLPFSWELKQEITANLNIELAADETDTHRSAYERVKQLLDVLEDGKYGVYYCRELDDAPLIFPPLIHSVKDRNEFLRKWDEVESDDAEFNIDTLLIEPYDDYFPVIATQNEIDQARVEYYADQIKQGRRPHAVIFCSCFEQSTGSINDVYLYSNLYVIDGHHKLLAYQKEGIFPAVIFIAHLPDSLENVEPSGEKVFDNVQPYHFAAMMGCIKSTDGIALKIMESDNELMKQYLKKYSRYFGLRIKTEPDSSLPKTVRKWWQKLFGSR